MEFKSFVQQAGLEAKEYQSKGVEWCVSRESSDEYCKGGIVADEMGLGKTIMIIGTILENFCMPTLIVLPVALLEQWREQIQQTTGHNCFVYHGAVKKLVNSLNIQKIPIVLTTYGTLVSDSKKEKKLQQVQWNRIVYDEAHHLRNKRTKVYGAARSMTSKITWLITGTPIQNHINDLYSLFDILGISNKVYTKTNNLRFIMENIVMKRTKKEVGIQLPEVHYNRLITSWKNENERDLTADIHENISTDKNMMLAMMMFERMMCIYPGLINEKNLKTLNDMGVGVDKNVIPAHSKMDDVIKKVIERKDNNNRKIIFTTFKDETDYIKKTLEDVGMTVEYIDGRVTKRQRKVILGDALDVLILQIKTGNEGLNLQKYNEVYFVTPDWNPQVEEQAIARCHRIGQTKEVHVFRFVMNGFTDDGSSSNIEMYSEQVQKAKREIEEQMYVEVETR